MYLPHLHLVQYLPQIWCNSHYFSYTDAQMADLHNAILHVQINSCILNICSKRPGGAEHILSSLLTEKHFPEILTLITYDAYLEQCQKLIITKVELIS